MKVNRNMTNTKTKHVWQRYISLLCIIALLLTALIGCASADDSDELDALRDDLGAQIDTLKAENEALKGEIGDLREDYDKALAKIDALSAASTSAEQKLSTLRSNYEAALKRITELQNSYDTENRDFDAMQNSYNEAIAEFTELKTSYDATVAELGTLRANYDALAAELEELQGGDTPLSEQLASLRADYDAAMLEIEQLRAQLEELDNIVNPPKIRIYIDQGHNPTGYHNTGASGNGLYEQDITFNIGKLLANMLKEDGRFEICLSRPQESTVLGTDNESSLEARVQGAKDFGADFFISLHINSHNTADAHGIEVYVTEEGSESYAFGNALLGGLIASTNLRDRGMKLYPYYVIQNATMPAALLEMGFITNEGDAALLANSPELFAEGIYNGILNYFELPEANS